MMFATCSAGMALKRLVYSNDRIVIKQRLNECGLPEKMKINLQYNMFTYYICTYNKLEQT